MILTDPTSGQGRDPVALGLIVQGTVQGVGFRPFVHSLATAEHLSGWVRNSADGVHIAIFGKAADVDRFRHRLRTELPPLARIVRIGEEPITDRAPDGFAIIASMSGNVRTSVTPDASLCAACRRELFDPADRRHHYPFLNCTQCGPRFSIVLGLPYDRANTSMRRFDMCPACQAEYEDVSDRRFHAQPTACPACGPAIWCAAAGDDTATVRGMAAIEEAQCRLRRGEIVAIRGIGGYHLACDGLNGAAITRLRERKRRPGKPFAVMVRDIAVASRYCRMGRAERDLLESPAAPIVLAAIRPDAPLPANLAPGLDRLGLMLPYSPLHALLMAPFDRPLVMTSGNAGENPQAIDNDEALRELSSFVDAFLMHDRDIVNRIDDSVIQVGPDGPQILRRARGYAPEPVLLPPGFDEDHPQVLALGGDIKNAFAIAKAGNAVLSQHIGDLTGLKTYTDLEKTVRLYGALYDLDPSVVVADRHPGYRSTRFARTWAEARGLPVTEVLHHHAHAASCMAEHGLELNHPPVLALVQDGIGMGEGGALWGAELLLCDYRAARRLASLKPAALAGGDRAAREPWRNLAIRLSATFPGGEEWPAVFRQRLAERPVKPLLAAARAGINAPLCSSAGRLFDAVAAAVGLCVDRQDYEGEAAMRLQAVAEAWMERHGSPDGYGMDLATAEDGLMVVDPGPVWPTIARDLDRGASAGEIAARFHRGWADIWARVVRVAAGEDARRDTVLLSGGVFQNRLLGSMIRLDLESSALCVLQHRTIPANDGGLALGQVVVALARHAAEGKGGPQPYVPGYSR